MKTDGLSGLLRKQSDWCRLMVAVLIPLAAFGLQWFFWAAIQPYVWLLFYPAVFFSSWVGGLRGGLVATGLSAGLVWYFFIPPQVSFAVQRPTAFLSIAVFAGMGVLFSFFHERMRKTNRRAAEALAAAQSAKDELEARVTKRTADLQTANELLREGEAQLRTLGDNIPGGALYQLLAPPDGRNRFTYMSAGIERIFGIPADRVLADPEAFWDRIVEEDRPRMEAAQTKSARDLTVFDCELRQRTIGDEIKWVHCRSTPRRLDDGSILWDGVVADITGRKQAEQHLRESEERFRMLVDVAPEAIFIQTKGCFAYVNAAALRLFGATQPAELLGQPVLSRIHPDYHARTLERIKLLNEQRQRAWAKDMVFITVDGSAKDVITSGVPFSYQNENGALVFAVDITERKRAEAEIQRLAQVVEQATESIVITDTEGTIQYVNPAFEKVTGYTRQEAIGQNPRILKSGKHDDAFFKYLWETIRRGDVWRGHLVNKRKDGTLFEEDAVISPVRDAAGAITSFAAVKDDMTLQMRLEQHLQQTQKLDGIGRLAGGVAHDFNNILTATLMHLSLLMDDARVDKTLRKDLKGLEAQALRAAALTRQLLLFSRRTVMQVIPLQLNEAVTNLMKMLGRILGEDIRTEFQFGNNLPLIEADAGMMEQVITNLAVNARDAMPKGGKLIFATYAVSISKEEALQHPKRRPGRFASLAVTDTGCGMDEKTMARIFEPFFTTKEVGKGTGLGLATVYGIIQQHSGWIEVASEVGKGSTFTIFLPVMEDASARETKSGAAAPVLGGNETILLVEDEARVRKMLSTFLTRLGYCVLEASRGYEARDVWHQNGGAIDLLFTDMVMPGGLTGLELAESLRSQKPSLRVIISSGYSADLAGHDDLSAKGFRFAPKPCLPRELAALVRTCLDAKP